MTRGKTRVFEEFGLRNPFLIPILKTASEFKLPVFADVIKLQQNKNRNDHDDGADIAV
jgi:hypothetical protein